MQQNFLLDSLLTRNKKIVFFAIINVTCYAYGIFFFVMGFMPIQVSEKEFVTFSDFPSEPHFEQTESECIDVNSEENQKGLYEESINKLVFIVVDALRADFISSLTSHSYFFNEVALPYTEHLISEGKATSFICSVYSPTVTLPRIKSLMTGTIPSFLDVMLNFNALELREDNIISQAYMRGKHIIFYGDDTWLKLYPGKFHRHEGTHSFFVSDYDEVDQNVTRHLSSEFRKSDWDIMVLHYLGVDHLGHSKGPHSTLMIKKLKEMDKIIQQIYEQLKSSNSSLPNVIVICGDHGMTARGSHGGVSSSELLTPLIFISTKPLPLVLPCLHTESVTQTDIAATLAVLLGLPIPSSSIGNIIPQVLVTVGLMTPQQVLYALYYNLIQLSTVHKQIFGSSELCKNSFKEIVFRHSKWLKNVKYGSQSHKDPDYLYLLKLYQERLSILKDQLQKSSSGYKDMNMVLGILVVSYTTLLLVYVLLCSITENDFSGLVFIPLLTITAALFSHDMVNLFFHYQWFKIIVYSTIFISFTLGFVLLLRSSFCIARETLRNVFINEMCGKQVMFILLHIFSLSSSSFIEEEHQTWYFISSTVLALYFWKHLSDIYHTYLFSDASNNKLVPNSKLTVLDDDRAQSSIPFFNKKELQQLFAAVCLLALNRICRSWNQTGDKWAHLPDISDWLLKEENSLYLRTLVVLSQLIILTFLRKMCPKMSCVMFSGMVWIYFQKCHTESLSSLGLRGELFGSRVVLLHSAVLATIGVFRYLGQLYKLSSHPSNQDLLNLLGYFIGGWILMLQLISRLQNIPLLAAMLLTEHFLNEITWKNEKDDFKHVTTYLLVSMCSFFYQGNSNSLSTLDVYAGYTGLSSYQPILIGVLIACNTYSGPLMWLFMLLYRKLCLYHNDSKDSKTLVSVKYSIANCFLGLVCYRTIVLSSYLIILFFLRFHLFIYTVFAPKLMYEVAHTVVYVTIYIILVVLL